MLGGRRYPPGPLPAAEAVWQRTCRVDVNRSEPFLVTRTFLPLLTGALGRVGLAALQPAPACGRAAFPLQDAASRRLISAEEKRARAVGSDGSQPGRAAPTAGARRASATSNGPLPGRRGPPAAERTERRGRGRGGCPAIAGPPRVAARARPASSAPPRAGGAPWRPRAAAAAEARPVAPPRARRSAERCRRSAPSGRAGGGGVAPPLSAPGPLFCGSRRVVSRGGRRGGAPGPRCEGIGTEAGSGAERGLGGCVRPWPAAVPARTTRLRGDGARRFPRLWNRDVFLLGRGC